MSMYRRDLATSLFCGVGEVCDIANCNPWQPDTLVDAGALPPPRTQPGRHRRWLRSEVIEACQPRKTEREDHDRR